MIQDFIYYPITGVLLYRGKPCTFVKRGRLVTSRLNGSRTSAARIAYRIMTGEWVKTILYEDGNTSNIKWRNIRYPLSHRLSQLQYDPITGALTRRGKSLVKYIINRPLIRVDGKRQVATRVIYKLMTGEYPPSHLIVDHIDGNFKNNRWNNLRLATLAENSRNVTITPKNKTGKVGVFHRKGRWISHARLNGTRYWLGTFDTFEEAANARDRWEIKNSPNFRPRNTRL